MGTHAGRFTHVTTAPYRNHKAISKSPHYGRSRESGNPCPHNHAAVVDERPELTKLLVSGSRRKGYFVMNDFLELICEQVKTQKINIERVIEAADWVNEH